MIFNRFRLNIVIRIIIIFLLSFAGIFILLNKYFWLIGIWIFIIVLLLIIELLRYIEQSHKKLKNFLTSIEQEDFMVETEDFDKYHKDMSETLINIQNLIKKFRFDAEINFQYLQMIVDQTDVALICFNNNGKVRLLNKAFQDLFKILNIGNINIIKKNDPEFSRLLNELQSGETRLIRTTKTDRILNLSVHKSTFKLENEAFNLLSFKDVQKELDQKEIESWQKLTRVLTHEIMNSAIPISNLSSILKDSLFDQNGNLKSLENLDNDQKDDLKESLRVIEGRSKGLVNFVNATKSITKIPSLSIADVTIDSLISHSITLMKQKIEENNIQIDTANVTKNLQIRCDEEQIQRVLINLLGNAIDALKGISDPKISISASRDSEKHVEISIKDNGCGISTAELENIFIPFFTTKEKGSGIGLTLSRQIIFMHRGFLSAKSEEGVGTEFIIKL